MNIGEKSKTRARCQRVRKKSECCDLKRLIRQKERQRKLENDIAVIMTLSMSWTLMMCNKFCVAQFTVIRIHCADAINEDRFYA